MAKFVMWDNGFRGMVRHLPAALEGRDSGTLALLGYRELVVREPEDYIPRFSGLLGSSEFELLPDGRVLQTFPHADFSVAAVREELGRMARQDAGRELGRTDWYITRKAELGTKVPKEVTSLRKKIRDHVDWIVQDIAGRSPRELVEYSWKFPTSNDQTMVNGVPVVFAAEPPIPPPALPAPPPPVDPVTGEAVGVFGNADPGVVDPAPPPPPAPEPQEPPSTTDGPVPVFLPGEEHPDFSALDVPLVTVYAPNVEDTGPRPDND